MLKEDFKNIIDICSNQENVKENVFRNHDNNLWWPLEIEDYRKRLIIAGLSTRISYNMINTYKKVIYELDSYTYEDIVKMNEVQIINIIKRLGLSNSRYKYIKSMISFIEKYQEKLLSYGIDDLILMINDNVHGASYKVAQCCILYMKGYYCGIMPVDSGMKDMELPCLGFEKYTNAKGHNILRKQLEELVKNNDFSTIIKSNGYNELNIPDYKNATWWTHLVLIYYKRHYCNKHKPEECPLKDTFNLKYSCKRLKKGGSK